MDKTLTKSTIQRLLKVDHAGEYGAIRIYRTQLIVARWRAPLLVAFLEETLAHEMEHCRIFKATMPNYATRPCRAMWLWSCGGYTLGLLTGLCGRNAILLCTAAMERTVHRHMQEQIAYLEAEDAALAQMIASIQAQEIEHLHYAERLCRQSGLMARLIDGLVRHSTELVIRLSTWGDSVRMRKELAPKGLNYAAAAPKFYL